MAFNKHITSSSFLFLVWILRRAVHSQLIFNNYINIQSSHRPVQLFNAFN